MKSASASQPSRGGIRGYVPEALFLHPAWLAWKAGRGWSVARAEGDFVVLGRKIGETASMAYAPCPLSLMDAASPEGEREYGAALEALSTRAMPFLPEDCAFIRWDLSAPAWADAEGFPLDVRLQELRMNASTVGRRLRKAPAERLCVDTMVVDLSGGSETLLCRMDYRTRYSVRLAGRRGTVVERAGSEGLRDFHELHVETARRHGLEAHPESAFRDLFAAAREHGLGLELYSARSEGMCAASAIIARHGGEAWYLFAASSGDRRRSAGPTAVLYRALADCADAGDERMDLLGVSPAGCAGHPLAGLSLFKSGFGGLRRRRAGTWDYVIDEEVYAEFVKLEAVSVN
jgi:hypothetical protein